MTTRGPRASQPSLEDLGTLLSEVTFCVVDLETTGGARDDAITEIGAVKVRGGQVLGEFQTLVNPGIGIPPLITVLTGITNAMVTTAPDIATVLPAFLEFAKGTVWVAHNARFDVGFLRRACEELSYPWPSPTVIDTVALARQALLREEVPNCKLATLAAYFATDEQPSHRALADARATVDVLHGLMERVGNLGVSTLEDLQEYLHRVSPQRRAKRVWAQDLPAEPGVYYFYSEASATGLPAQVLYVGKSQNIRRRVRSYFTASEKRARMEEMIRVASGVKAVPCTTALEAEIRELRMIASHAPRYNRRSRNQDRQLWVKITAESFPRLSIVRQIKDDGCSYWGPFTSRLDAEDACLAVQEAWPLRRCTTRIGPRSRPDRCALGEMGRCLAPCDAGSTEQYSQVVAAVRQAISVDIRPTLAAVGVRLAKLSSQERFEEAGELVKRVNSYTRATLRWNRLQAVAGCAQIVAAELVDGRWQLHVFRFGKLAGAGVVQAGQSPTAAVEQLLTLAETVRRPIAGMPAGTVEECERVASWLEHPGVRLVDVDGDWSLPIHAGVNDSELAQCTIGSANEAENPRMAS